MVNRKIRSTNFKQVVIYNKIIKNQNECSQLNYLFLIDKLK